MTREELVNNPEYRFTSAELDVLDTIYPSNEFEAERSAFDDGVEWAKEYLKDNPMWYNYKTDRNFPKNVILHTTDGTFSAEYDEHLSQFMSGGEWVDETTIIAWMELPKPPKFD